MIICLDTNCIIYLVENNPTWGPKVATRLADASRAGDSLAACDLARPECIVGPLRNGDAALLADYQSFFSDPMIRMLPLTASVCEKAAEIRVSSGMRFELLDCLHLAAAVEHGCDVFLTNDVKLARCTQINVEVLT